MAIAQCPAAVWLYSVLGVYLTYLVQDCQPMRLNEGHPLLQLNSSFTEALRSQSRKKPLWCLSIYI